MKKTLRIALLLPSSAVLFSITLLQHLFIVESLRFNNVNNNNNRITNRVKGGSTNKFNDPTHSNVSPVIVQMIGTASSSLLRLKTRTGWSTPRAVSSLWTTTTTTSSSSRSSRGGRGLFGSNESPEKVKRMLQIITLLRIALPSIAAGILASLVFPFLALTLATLMNDAGVFAVLSQDSSQFVQNFLTVAGLLFSILVGQTYYFMYIQQEAVYYSLFNEVTEAKSLLEQVALICQGRSMYIPMLKFIQKYVDEDLKQIHKDPAVLLSARPIDDPLESIMYMTSVGVPSIVYETVRSLRQARAARLGALQRKLPKVHMWLLWILAFIELMSFPLLGAGTQTIGGYRILTVEGCLFGVMTFGVVMTLRIVGELWRPAGGAYNVDGVLRVMVRGLEEELMARMSGKTYAATLNFPLPQFHTNGLYEPMTKQFVEAVEAADITPTSGANKSVTKK